jgi:hypothetical protein
VAEDYGKAVAGGLFALEWSPGNPFQSPEPDAWFDSLVSVLYRLLFEAGPPLRTLGKFAFDPRTGEFVGDAPTGLVERVGDLRTVIYHELDRDGKRDRQRLARISGWYRSICGAPERSPSHSRRLADALLHEWEEFLGAVASVASHLGTASTAGVVRDQIDLDTRGVPLATFLRIAQEVVEAFAPEGGIDINRLRHRYHEEVKKAIRQSSLTGPALIARVRALIEGFVARELTSCPVTGPWLREQKIAPHLIAGLVARFHARWDAGQDPVAFLDGVSRELREEGFLG